MTSSADLFVVCKQCGSEVSPYITECPYCGHRLRRRAPKLPRAHPPSRPIPGTTTTPFFFTSLTARLPSVSIIVRACLLVTSPAASEVKKNGVFVVPGIGRLVRQDRKARMGRNPATGEAIKIPAKKVVKFRVAKACKDAIVPPKVKKA